ncbi:MAG: hypothetical protein JWQ58_699 [Reyranella sp.]|nr:hypothetical protein [Reyranella sp.]
MIDDQRDGATALLRSPLARQQGETQRIATAGNGNSEIGTCLERRKRRHQAREGRSVDGKLLAKVAHPQPFFERSWSIRRFCRSVARG